MNKNEKMMVVEFEDQNTLLKRRIKVTKEEFENNSFINEKKAEFANFISKLVNGEDLLNQSNDSIRVSWSDVIEPSYPKTIEISSDEGDWFHAVELTSEAYDSLDDEALDMIKRICVSEKIAAEWASEKKMFVRMQKQNMPGVNLYLPEQPWEWAGLSTQEFFSLEKTDESNLDFISAVEEMMKKATISCE